MKEGVVSIVICGGGGVGKSAMTIQFVQQHFVEEYDPTIEDSYRKQTEVDGKVYLLDILDTAGQEEYSAMQDQYMRQGDGYLMVYSITSRVSFEEIKKYVDKAVLVRDVNDPSELDICIFGNKTDLAPYRQVFEHDPRIEFPQLFCIEGSAKNNINVQEAFFQLVRMVVNRTNVEVKNYKRKKEKCIII